MAVSANGDERRVLPIDGATVVQVCIDFAFTLRLDHGGDAYEIRIEQAFTFTGIDGVAVTPDPENDPTGLGPVLAVTRTAVAWAAAYEDGRLEMGFADGSHMKVPPSPEFEGWELSGPDGLRFVSGPGPRLTTWQPG